MVDRGLEDKGASWPVDHFNEDYKFVVPQLALVFLLATPRLSVAARSDNQAPPNISPSPTSAHIRC